MRCGARLHYFILLLLVACPACHHAPPPEIKGDPDPTICVTLKRKYEMLDAALFRKRYDTIEDLTTADFVYKTTQGYRYTRKQMIDSLQATSKVDLVSMSRITHCSVDDSNVKAEVEIDLYQRATYTDSKDKQHENISHLVTQDVWEKVGGVWKRRSVTEVSHSATFDGVKRQ